MAYEDGSFDMIEATFDAYAPGSTPDILTALAFTPSLTAIACGPSFTPFSDEDQNGRSSPAIVFPAPSSPLNLEHGLGETHREVSAIGMMMPDDGFAFGGSPTHAVVPDASHMDMDDAPYAYLEHRTPEWVKTQQSSSPHLSTDIDLSPDADVKTEFVADDDVPSLPSLPSLGKKTASSAGKTKRPSRGAGSRRKVKEEIRDALDAKIYKLVPPDKLRLSKADFQVWKESSGFPKLTDKESARLAKIRRMILARVYAERNRLKKIAESEESGETLKKVTAENARLRAQVAKMEAIEKKLQQAQAEIARLRGGGQ